ncbi:hypothetical protein LTR85_001403 [Meristemomyces frigidus]|nr:hypothetical protein LTR85_001403 [Meristemomyces frigidus]
MPPGMMSVPMTPNFSGNSPRAFSIGSVPGTPAPPSASASMQTASNQFVGMQSPTQVITPRFGMIGLGAPQGSQHDMAADVLAWDGYAPEAPRDYHPAHYQPIRPAEDRSCCQGPSSPPPAPSYDQYVQYGHLPALPQQATFAPFPCSMMPTVSIPEPEMPRATQAALDYDKFNNDYFNYQFPSAICQTCGLSGCTCRNCPPVMQNASNGSWAQMCGRKHARTAAYIAPNTISAFQQQLPPQAQQFGQPSDAPPHAFQHQSVFQDTGPFLDGHQQQQSTDSAIPPSIPGFMPFDPGEDFALPEGANNMDISDLLLSDLDRPSSGCCCGDP